MLVVGEDMARPSPQNAVERFSREAWETHAARAKSVFRHRKVFGESNRLVN